MAYPLVGTATNSMASPSYANPISSMGAPQETVQQPNPSAAKAQQLVDSFGQIFTPLNDLAGQFPGASNEFNMVVEALKNWLAKASDSIASEGGGNSPTY